MVTSPDNTKNPTCAVNEANLSAGRGYVRPDADLLLITNGTIMTMDGTGRVVEGYVSVRGNRIEEVAEGAPPGWLLAAADEVIDASGCLVTPGLISCHQHVSDILLRGIGLGRDLFGWALSVYHPGTSVYHPEDAEVAVLLAMAEGLRAGITTLVDNWGAAVDPGLAQECSEAALDAYAQTGVRVVFARQFSDALSGPWLEALSRLGLTSGDVVESADTVFADTERLIGKHHGACDRRISVCLAPSTPHTVTPESLVEARALAERLGTPLTIHHCETRAESHIFTRAGNEVSSTLHLDHLNLLDDRLLAAHCVWVDEDDIALLARNQVRVAHCPTSNLILGSGIAPVARLRRAGVTVALGCDNAMLNNNVALLPEARLAGLLASGSTLDPSVLGAEAVLQMATSDGARAIGLEHDLGVLAPGRLADLLVIEATGTHWIPLHDPFAALIFQSLGGDIRDVVVDGRVVMRHRELSWLDTDREEKLRDRARAAAAGVVKRAGLGSP